MKSVWSKYSHLLKENRKPISCSQNALLPTDLVHLLAFYRLWKLQNLRQDFEHSPIRIGVGRGGARPPPNNLRGGANIPFGPPNNPPTCTGKTIALNSILEFSIISYFKMKNVIIWHWFIKNLVGTRRRNDVVTMSCACWELGPPPPPNILNLAPPPPPPPMF